MNRLKDVLYEVAGYMDEKCNGEDNWYLDDGESECTYAELVNKMEEEDVYWEDRYTWQFARGGANIYRMGEDGFKCQNPVYMARRYEDDGYPGWMPWEFGAMNR